MRGLFIPEITAEMFRNGCLETIEALMAEGEIYDIEYSLKQEPCEDCISRKAAEEITWEEPAYSDKYNVLTEVRDKVRALPSVQPTQKWIPVSERLPEKDVECMVVYCSEDGIVGTCMYYNAFNRFKGSLHPETAFDDIVAWMPIEPYKQEEQG